MAGRPFANAVATMPLPATGKQLDMPKVATAPAAAVQAAEADPVNEVNFDGETISTPKVLIAGQNDLSIQAYEFADPGMDTVIMRELTKSYNSVLDTQMLTGTGANGQHDGFKNVANINSITYSAVGSAGGADGLVGAIYDAVSQIATNAPGYMADAVVMHPRRGGMDRLPPRRQRQPAPAGLVRARIRRPEQRLRSLGCRPGCDPRPEHHHRSGVRHERGRTVRRRDRRAHPRRGRPPRQGPDRSAVRTLQVRLQLYAFSAFVSNRRPKTICRISGVGLAAPSFPST